MEQLEKKFAIRRITESADEDYEPALEIYRTIPHNIRIDDKAITFWLDKEEGDKFELLVFVLYLNDEIVALIDTNILLDFLQNRETDGEFANKIIELCAKKIISGFMAAHSISNAFYILRKDYSVEKRKEMLINLCNIVDIVDIDKQKILASLHNEDFSDIEDCLQMECAMRANVDYIITRNLSDFATSKIPAILPNDFLNIIETKITP